MALGNSLPLIALLCLVLALGHAANAERNSDSGDAPGVNVILLMADQMRGDVMGCAGNPVAITPNLDKLASEGVVSAR